MKPVLFGVDVNWCFFQFFIKAALQRIVRVVLLSAKLFMLIPHLLEYVPFNVFLLTAERTALNQVNCNRGNLVWVWVKRTVDK